MPIKDIVQPQLLQIEDNLRLRKIEEDYSFALDWYKDIETVRLVDGVSVPYDLDKLNRMYSYLEKMGEAYFIEIKEPDSNTYSPIGDVTFWQEDMPIVIGNMQYRGKGIGRKVVSALIERAKQLDYAYLEVSEIYDYNIGSQKLFESVGFKKTSKQIWDTAIGWN